MIDSGQDITGVAFIVFPGYIAVWWIWPGIGDGIISHIAWLTGLAARQFIPGVIRLACAVLVLHDPGDGGFGGTGSGIAYYHEVRPRAVEYGVIESENYITPECTEANKSIGISYNSLGGGIIR